MTRSRTWNIGTAVVVVLILVAGWFLAVQPQRSAATESRATRDSVEAQNTVTQNKINALKEARKDIPKQRADIEAIRLQMPEQPLQPALLRQFARIAERTNVTLGNISPGAIVPLANASGVSQIPLEIGAVGNYDEVRRFLSALELNPRAVVVTGFKLAPAPDAAEGATPNDPDDLALTVTARVFMSKATGGIAPTQPSPNGAAAGTTPSDTPTSPSSADAAN